MIRIQSGEDKGKDLKMPKTPTLRPSSNKVREALVDILRSKGILLGADVLDIYAGTGAVGFELLSNGAKEVVFVEKSRVGQQTIIENAQKLKKSERILVIKDEALKALENLKKEGKKFNIIYADPPYNISDDELQAIEEHIVDLLSKEGLFVLEHSSKRTFNPKYLITLTQKKYGDTMLTFYGRAG
ncbi:MAG: 16S rRNA (guanine(966)-N(2))-methyltransferase RsmD [Actinobacteria bacterium]|nr:16S rRNA (guanine(966)-N(2))-methyltransferase RsmD [Actinomycetota bacterium]